MRPFTKVIDHRINYEQVFSLIEGELTVAIVFLPVEAVAANCVRRDPIELAAADSCEPLTEVKQMSRAKRPTSPAADQPILEIGPGS